jgi:imidazoleglycerol-phosphate dehydratase
MSPKAVTRRAERTRETKETKIRVEIDLDGMGRADVRTGVGFFDHLLGSLAHHALFDLDHRGRRRSPRGRAPHGRGRLHWCSGQALGEARWATVLALVRFGEASVPDGRGRWPRPWWTSAGGRTRCWSSRSAADAHRHAAARSWSTTRWSRLAQDGRPDPAPCEASGRNDHHVAEAAFKALARALRAAVALDERRVGVPSTKGSLA